METKEKIFDVVANLILLVGIVLLLFSPLLFKTETKHSKEYPQTMVITSVNETLDFVVIETSTGFSYIFDGTEDYEVGDLVSVIMNDNLTENDITDDRIVEVRYSGFTESEVR